ncbi:MAG: glycosyltransferase family 39 protein, partial [Anaerolineae bacterium]|nr:glycosyltransferase family 39 protein [Anaerolineae bacterium]
MKTSRPLLLILLLALCSRVWLIQTDQVAFSSDEAIVGLMARHITQGYSIPTFYYGQDYMGSLDAVLVAVGFEILGESVRTIRYVQLVLYLLIIWTSYLLAYRVTRRRSAALMTALLVAVPSMLGTTYTTLTLGGYNEILLLGNLALLLGWQVTVEQSESTWHWGTLGFVLGVGWWVNGAIITPLAVVGLMGLRYFSLKKWWLYLLAAAGFFFGSGLWWLYNFRHEWAALEFLLSDQL